MDTTNKKGIQNSLISLAILNVNMNEGKVKDYLDYLRPFIAKILSSQNLKEFNSQNIQSKLEEMGLYLPLRTVEVVLGRFVDEKVLRIKKLDERTNKSDKIYFPGTLNISDNSFDMKRSNAQRDISHVAKALIKFSEEKPLKVLNEIQAVEYIVRFLSAFSIDCLRLYEKNTIFPPLNQNQEHFILVADFLKYLENENLHLFDRFFTIVKGHMLANALLCPDLKDSYKEKFKKTTFYLDTPLVTKLLNLESKYKYKYAKELVDLIKKLKGSIAVFGHTRDEISSVIRGAARNLWRTERIGGIILEMRERGFGKNDLLLEDEKLDENLNRHGINIAEAPPYDENNYSFQINEQSFKDDLEEIRYSNEYARYNDIKSVRAIYVLRRGRSPKKLEDAHAVLVTSNKKLAKIAYKHGRKIEDTKNVSPVITDFEATNIAWLKLPLEEKKISTASILASAYAALDPSNDLMTKYLNEIERLEKEGRISHGDYAIMRSRHALTNITSYTLGKSERLNNEVILKASEKTKEDLIKESPEIQKIIRERDIQRERTRRFANYTAWAPACLIPIAFSVLAIYPLHKLLMFISGIYLAAPNISIEVDLLTGLGLFFTISGICIKWVRPRISNWIFKKLTGEHQVSTEVEQKSEKIIS